MSDSKPLEEQELFTAKEVVNKLLVPALFTYSKLSDEARNPLKIPGFLSQLAYYGKCGALPLCDSWKFEGPKSDAVCKAIPCCTGIIQYLVQARPANPFMLQNEAFKTVENASIPTVFNPITGMFVPAAPIVQNVSEYPVAAQIATEKKKKSRS